MKLEGLAFNEWFQERLGEPQKQEYNLARVTAVNKNGSVGFEVVA